MYLVLYLILVTSFDRTLTNSHLSALMENLTTVDLPSSVNDPVLSTGRDQVFAFVNLFAKRVK